MTLLNCWQNLRELRKKGKKFFLLIIISTYSMNLYEIKTFPRANEATKLEAERQKQEEKVRVENILKGIYLKNLKSFICLFSTFVSVKICLLLDYRCS